MPNGYEPNRPAEPEPVSYTHLDVYKRQVPECFSKQFALFYKALMPVLVHRVARVVTVSEFSRQRIIEFFGLDPSRVDVIENGVSANFRSYSDAEIEVTRRELALPARYLLPVSYTHLGRELVFRRAGHVQNLATQGQNRLIGAVARLFG